MARYLAHFNGKTIFLTGAASGIGRALTLHLACPSVRFVLVDVQEPALADVVRLAKAQGAEVHAAVCDVSDLTAMRALREALPAAFGDPDIVIANAGISQVTRVEAYDPVQTARIAAVNYIGSVNAVSLFLPAMIAKKSGHLVAISALAALRGPPGAACYAASKAAQALFFEGLRVDLRAHGVNVTRIFPGFVDTPINQPLRQLYRLPHIVPADKAARLIARAIARGRTRLTFPRIMAFLSLFAPFLSDRTHDRLLTKYNPYRLKPSKGDVP